MFARYAIFHTAPSGALADFGAVWLGWDSAAGAAVQHPQVAGFDVAALTAVPRKYGFHATLKAPFRLAMGATFDGLVAAVTELAALQKPVMLDGLRLNHLGGFVALTPEGDTSELGRLAAGIVNGLDSFRGPQTEAELARRNAAGLTERQAMHLATWGYPYVLDDFHFHMTLTGPMAHATRSTVIAALAPMIAPLLPRPYYIADLTLMGQDVDGMFHQIHRYALTA